MKTEKKQFIEFLVASGCLKFGDFQLKSGDRSPFFVNLGQADSGAKLDVVGRTLAEASLRARKQVLKDLRKRPYEVTRGETVND